jgi:hypothetical protein
MAAGWTSLYIPSLYLFKSFWTGSKTEIFCGVCFAAQICLNDCADSPDTYAYGGVGSYTPDKDKEIPQCLPT